MVLKEEKPLYNVKVIINLLFNVHSRELFCDDVLFLPHTVGVFLPELGIAYISQNAFIICLNSTAFCQMMLE